MTVATYAGVLRAFRVYVAVLSSDQNASGYGGGWTFLPLAITIKGGTGPFTFVWTRLDDGIATWNDLTGAAPTPVVSAVPINNSSNARYHVVVTDTGAAGATSQSNEVYLAYYHISLNFGPILP